MDRLGYDYFYAQGGDWGAGVTISIGAQNQGRCRGIHLNMPTAGPPRASRANPSVVESRVPERIKNFERWGSGYHKLRPHDHRLSGMSCGLPVDSLLGFLKNSTIGPTVTGIRRMSSVVMS